MFAIGAGHSWPAPGADPAGNVARVGRDAPDPVALARVIERFVERPVEVGDLRRYSGGASRETWAVDATDGHGELHELVLRRDPATQSSAANRATEYALLSAAGACGVPVPRVRALLRDDDGLGAGFLMDRVAGETIARRILRDAEYQGARAVLAEQAGAIAARIHRVGTDALPDLPVLPAEDQIAQQRALLDAFDEPHPAFELGLRWLERHVPAAGRPPALVHGDYRNGNFIVGPDGIRAVLDWELAHLGDPVEDLGWLCVKSWRFGNADQVAGGFGALADLLAAYRRGGRHAGRRRRRSLLGRARHREVGDHLRRPGARVRERHPAQRGDGRARASRRRDGVGPARSARRRLVMTQDRPSAADLVTAVREFLERDVMAATEGRVQFHTRVAVNVLSTVARELELGEGFAIEERSRAAALLGHDGEPDALERELAAAIRSGALDDRDEVRGHVRATVREKLLIANPGYLPATPSA